MSNINYRENLDVPIPVKISGSVTLNSGFVGAVALTDDGGGSVAYIGGIANADAQYSDSNLLGVANFNLAYDKDFDRWNRVRVNKSGQGALVVASSGSDYIQVAAPMSGKARPLLSVTGASGGVILTSGAVTALTVKALTGNSGDIFIGFNVSTEMPYSGYGMLLDAGDSWTIDIDEIGRVRAFATMSGDLVSYAGVTR